MKDNTIHIFNCEKCNKEVEIQCVYELLIYLCGDCYLEEHFKGDIKNE